MNETTMDKKAAELIEGEDNIVKIAECTSGQGVQNAVKVALIGTAVVAATVGIVKGVKAFMRRRAKKHQASDVVVCAEDGDVIDVQVDE